MTHGTYPLEDILAEDFINTRIFINGCNSGNGSVNPGQGIMSLGLVFGISGADEVITHLWQAEDRVSENISVKFYSEGVPKDFSSRISQVKINYLETAPAGFDHPHFWGGIVCSAKPVKKAVGYYGLVVSIVLLGFYLGVKWWNGIGR